MSKRAKTLSANSPKKKKLRYYVSFNNEWLKNDLFKNWLRKTDEHNANCIFCKSGITIKFDGFRAIENHLKSEKHQKNSSIVNKNDTINSFLVSKNT